MRIRRFVAMTTLALLAGCGVTTGGSPDRLTPSEVPYGLLSPVPASTAPPAVPPLGDQPRIYLVSAEDVLVPSGREVGGIDPRARLENLLQQLGAGPTADELDHELTTALPPGAQLSVAAVDGSTVTIDLTGPGEAPSGLRSRLAVAQIVLTATSVPGIRAVLLASDGKPLEAPLASGELTTAPLEAEDFARLLEAPPP